MARIVFSNANLVDGLHPAQPGMSVVVEDRHIAQVTRGPVPAAPGDRAIDLAGKTLMPGMFTCHFHSAYRDTGATPSPMIGLELPLPVLTLIAEQNFQLALDCGFTGVVCSSGPGAIDAALRDAVESGLIRGPRIFAGSRELTATADPADPQNRVWYYELGNTGTMACADGPIGFRALVREELKRGADIVKLNVSTGHSVGWPDGRCSIEPDELRAAAGAVHRRGRKLRAHACTKEAILECARAGVDVIDHADYVDGECVEAIAAAGSFVAPTALYSQRMLQLMENAEARQGTGPYGLRGEQVRKMARVHRTEFDNVCAMLPQLNRAGIKLVLGDDYGTLAIAHGEYARELELYVKHVGIPALDVIRWATFNGAELMGRAHELGSVEPGKLADLLVVDGDPLADITCLQDRTRLRAILKDGAFEKDALGT
jgi:imidazolonepropionase-like amidohydrolase